MNSNTQFSQIFRLVVFVGVLFSLALGTAGASYADDRNQWISGYGTMTPHGDDPDNDEPPPDPRPCAFDPMLWRGLHLLNLYL